MTPEQKSKLTKGLIVLLVIAAGVAVYLIINPSLKNPVELLEDLGKTGVEIPTTNPLENKVPELNPVEKFNPFKYENPLR